MDYANSNPGKIEISSEKLIGSLGQTFEVRCCEVVFYDNNILRRERQFENVPPLADSRSADSIQDVRECCGCYQFYFYDSVISCHVCGRFYCRICGSKITGLLEKHGVTVPLCPPCAEASFSSFFKRLIKTIWDD